MKDNPEATPRSLVRQFAGAIVLLAAGAMAGCDDSAAPYIDPGDAGSYDPRLDPAGFVGRIDNPYLPLLPGATWTYESADRKERIEVTVLAETRVVAGISATVVRDTVYEDGELVEDTFDWYAQDKEGNVWYLGEDTKEYENGKFKSTAGAWEAGKGGAQPGKVMLAVPKPGVVYRQEYYKGEAEDMARVLRLNERFTVRAGTYENVVVTEEWTPLQEKVVEEKSYAPGVGLIREVKTRGGKGTVELVSFTPGK